MAGSHARCCRPPLDFAHRCPDRADVAIVGGGFSGLLTLLHTLQHSPDAHIVVFERTPRPAPGVAYGACGPTHLLNVRADRMGAFPDVPGAFHRWLESRTPGRFAAADFVPRALYGQYLLDVVVHALERQRSRVDFVCDRVVDLTETPEGVRVVLESGSRCLASAAVLALGLPMAVPTWAAHDDGQVVADPWRSDESVHVDPDDAVVVAGTGLTALDLLVSLQARGHRGRVVFVSRSGRFPLPHAVASPVTAPAIDRAALIEGPRQAARAVRTAITRHVAAGGDWQSVLDAVRPHVTAVWQAWTPAARARFLRHLRAFWDIHRHRAPHTVLNLLKEGLAEGRISTLRGTIAGVSRGGTDKIVVTVRARGREQEIAAARIFNCLGPSMKIGDTCDPLMRHLLDRSDACADAASLGLRADDEGRVRRADGAHSERIFLLGALRRGDLWESTAVPELRVQAATVGAAVAASIAGRLIALWHGESREAQECVR